MNQHSSPVKNLTERVGASRVGEVVRAFRPNLTNTLLPHGDQSIRGGLRRLKMT